MDTFYLIVSAIALVILILILAYVGMRLRNHNITQAFPPNAYSCPDYWTVDGSNCIVPRNGKKNTGGIYNMAGDLLLTPSNTPGLNTDTTKYSGSVYLDITNTGWTAAGKSTDCRKKKWADERGLMWDGITNYNGC